MKLSFLVSVILKHLTHRIFLLLNLKRKIIPYKVLIQTTNDCNSQCEFCYIWKINKDKPDLKKLESKINDYESFFKGMNKNLLWLSLGGGEITIDPNSIEIIKLAQKNCSNLKLITFTTNGLNPKKTYELVKEIQKTNLSLFVTISLDGDENTHDKLRGIPGNYKKCFETYELLKSINIPTYFGVTLSESNHEFIMNEYHNYKQSMKSVTFVHSDGIYYRENDQKNSVITKSFKKIIKDYKVSNVFDWWELLYIKLGHKFLSNDKKIDIPCTAGLSSIHIDPYGDISPCMYLPKFTNIKDSNLIAEMTSEAANKIRSRGLKHDCQNCWMNCYAPHSMMNSPFKSILRGYF